LGSTAFPRVPSHRPIASDPQLVASCFVSHACASAVALNALHISFMIFVNSSFLVTHRVHHPISLVARRMVGLTRPATSLKLCSSTAAAIMPEGADETRTTRTSQDSYSPPLQLINPKAGVRHRAWRILTRMCDTWRMRCRTPHLTCYGRTASLTRICSISRRTQDV
jgi:hypothetical protein